MGDYRGQRKRFITEVIRVYVELTGYRCYAYSVHQTAACPRTRMQPIAPCPDPFSSNIAHAYYTLFA